jgi:WD40 repeat protein
MKQAGQFIMVDGIESMVFSPDGQRIVIADSDGTARVWNADTGAPVTPPLRHDDLVTYAAFNQDGRYVVTTSRDKTARIWDASTGEPLTPPLKHKGWVDFAMFTPDGRALKTVGRGEKQGCIETWDLTPDNHSTQDLQRLAQMLSLHRLDASGAFTPLDFDSMTNRSWILQR